MNAEEAQAVQLAGGQQLLIPFGENAHLVWTRTNGQTAAVGLVRQGNKTLNVSADGQERLVRFLPVQKVEKLLRKLREKSKFQQFEGKLAQKGKRVGKVRVLFDETNKIAILGIASEGSEEKIAHQVRIKLKADKDDEPEDDAEPAIQATACGQVTGEAVPEGATMQPLTAPPGERDIGGGYEGPQLCTSQWGYDYWCLSRTPAISLSTTSLTLPQTFITQQSQASFMIWNSGGGRLTGTVTTAAPFQIVSGSSFSLLPGQPQEVVVKFSSATAGSFSKSVTISSNGGSKAVTATGIAHKVSFSPAQLDFGSGLLVLREQCNQMGMCGPRTEKVGLPIEKVLTVKNEGSVAVSLTLSTAAPYKIVSVPPTLSPGQSGQVTLRFDPSESGSFTGTVQVGINGGQGSLTSPPLTGVAHKIELVPTKLDFGIAFVNYIEDQRLTVKNQGVTNISLTVSTTAPFSIASGNSFTLTPGQSSNVVVRISPTTSESISRTVRLTSGSNSFEVPVRARTMTYEEYAEAMLRSFNSFASLDGYYGIVYAWDNTGSATRHVLLAGFQNLDQSQMEHWLAMTESWESSPDPEQQELYPRLQEALDLLNSIDPVVLGGWLQELADAIVNNRFDEVYNTLLPQGLDKVERALLLILDSQDPQDAKTLLASFLSALVQNGVILAQPTNPYAPPITLVLEMAGFSLELMGYMVTVFVNFDEASKWASTFFDRWYHAYEEINKSFGEDAAKSFTNKLKEVANHVKSNYPAGFLICLTGCQLMNGLSGLLQYAATVSPDLVMGSIEILWNVTRPGDSNDPFDKPWTLIGIVGIDGTLFDPTRHGSFFLVERIITGGGRQPITVVAQGNHCSDCSYTNNILLWISEAIRVLDQQVKQTGILGFGQDRSIIIYVFTNRSAIGTDQALQAIENYVGNMADQARKATAILVVRVMPNGTVQYKCIGGACQMYTDEELKKMACKQATGRAACAAEPWSEPQHGGNGTSESPSPSELQGIIEEPDWDETEPPDPNNLPEPRCPVCQ
jgi:hypothetical protein